MAIEVKPNKEIESVYWVYLEDGSKKLATKNLVPGRSVYRERLIQYRNTEYRVWDPFRSKLAASILKGLRTVPIKPGHKVLYLGAASGTTASHVSDIVNEQGYVYCVEFAPRVIRELLNNVCAHRSNMSPILEDARFPERYRNVVTGKVDDIYCDIAQPEQAKVLVENAKIFLKKRGGIMLAVKSQSIDVTKAPAEIYHQEAVILRKNGFEIDDTVELEPYEKAHAMIVASM